MHSDAKRRIYRFEEKPKEPALLEELRMPAELLAEVGRPAGAELYQGSMGIYVFNRRVLIEALDNSYDDFGKHILPAALSKYQVYAYPFGGYWEDIGTVRAFWEANLALSDPLPAFDFFDRLNPIYTHARFLPASKVNAAQVNRAIIADGCIVTEAHLDRAIVGIRSVIERGSSLRNVVMMGADYYQDEAPEAPQEEAAAAAPAGSPPLGIGPGCRIEGAILDKNARIGAGVTISPEGKPANFDGPEGRYYLRDGVVVVPKGAIIPDGTQI
jgi:glucose-1-phosphate adenylyltransferase